MRFDVCNRCVDVREIYEREKKRDMRRRGRERRRRGGETRRRKRKGRGLRGKEIEG